MIWWRNTVNVKQNREKMKYLISKKIRNEDCNYFVENHDEDEFVGEPSLERIVAVAEEEKVWKLVDGFGLKPVSSILSDSIRQSLIADIDAVVCYEKDANEYGKFGKKIITIDLL